MQTKSLYERYFKRLLDIICSLLAIFVLSPLILILAMLVRFKLGSPIFFVQQRPGKNEKIFSMYKFRTMTEEKDKNGRLLPDDKRLNAFGKFLRSTSLDELPELLNIVRGDMSLIGPRPLLPEYLPLYNKEQRKRHDVRPGLTGLAQVNGRNLISWKEKFNFDIKYIENISFKLDFIILLKTVGNVVMRTGITDSQNISASKFNGEKKE